MSKPFSEARWSRVDAIRCSHRRATSCFVSIFSFKSIENHTDDHIEKHIEKHIERALQKFKVT